MQVLMKRNLHGVSRWCQISIKGMMIDNNGVQLQIRDQGVTFIVGTLAQNRVLDPTFEESLFQQHSKQH
jgi:exosome complex RNA-binding protein Rrp42 (RNase PH superfamily)